MLQVAEQSVNPQSRTCLNIRHAPTWVRNEVTAFGKWCVKCWFPETYATKQSKPPKSKWNPTRGPSWHSAPTASGQAPRFYVHCALYGSSYIPKYQSVPPDPLYSWNPNLISLPSIQQHLHSQGFFFFFLTQALLPPLTCLAWPGQEMHLHSRIRKGASSPRAKAKLWLHDVESVSGSDNKKLLLPYWFNKAILRIQLTNM